MLQIIRIFGTNQAFTLLQVFRDQRNLNDHGKKLTFGPETIETLNNFFLNIVKKLEIPKVGTNDSVTKNIKDSIFKAISKYENHPSILAIQKYSKIKIVHFEEVNIRERK